MSQYTCTLTYPADGVQLSWTPNKPTEAGPCQPGDTITFRSPDNQTLLNFGLDSPFEAMEGPKQYSIPQNLDTPFTIAARAKNKNFGFNCLPAGQILEGAGGSVPVGNGGH